MQSAMETRSGWRGVGVVLLVLALMLSQSAAQGPPPSSGDSCKGVDCQQGTCQPGLIPGTHTCQCQTGWDNLLGLAFLPCGFPKDCKIDFACNKSAPANAPPAPPPAFSLPNITWPFNPCSFSLCGFGDCVPLSNSGFLEASYSCNCHPGNANVLNKTSGTCLPECNFGASCTQLGLPLSGGKSPPPPGPTIQQPSAGLYPPGASPGQPPNAGKRCREVGTWLTTCAMGVAFWLLS